MNKAISAKITALVFGVLVISFLAAFYVVAWQEPAQSPPDGNVPSPLNVGPETQYKEGTLVVNTGGEEYGLVVDQGKVCIGDACIESWPEGAGVDTTYKMTVNSYCVGSGNFCGSKTASYSCPAGSTAVLLNCPRTLIGGGHGNDFYACSCSLNGNNASVKASAIKDTSCETWWARSAVDSCTRYSSWSGSCYYSCSSYSPCELIFKCGQENTVGAYTSEACSFSSYENGGACNAGTDAQFCQNKCLGAGWANYEMTGCSPNIGTNYCNPYGPSYSCGTSYNNCGCGSVEYYGSCNNYKHQVSCRCSN
ncbi:MAG: hypothetical protein WC919_06285 [Candidatus Paceibacterota bacterium]|jgi:hypothetical protein